MPVVLGHELYGAPTRLLYRGAQYKRVKFLSRITPFYPAEEKSS
ncbi:MAG: hypothetical protein U1F27_01620 [Turneriella sp.]